MFVFPALAAICASAGWASGIVLAHAPARAVGAFEFTRIQLISSGAVLGMICLLTGYWATVDWSYSASFAVSIFVGVILGNLAMIACLRRGGPRRTELLLSLKAPIVAGAAYFWLGEVPSGTDIFGAGLALAGVCLAIFFASNEKSDSDKLNGSLISVIMLGLIATTCQGIGFLVLKPVMLDGVQPLAVSAVRLLGAAFAISVVALWPARVFQSRTQMSPALLVKTILPGLIGYGFSSSLLLYAIANMEAGIATVLGSLSPIIVLLLLWVKERQVPHVYAIVGAILTVIGPVIIIVT